VSAGVPRVALGSTGLEVSKLALGTWGIGKAAPDASMGDDDRLIVDVLEAAFAAGINYLDSAEMYQNEERLGRLLTQVSNVPDDLVIASKFGRDDFTGDSFRRSVERSLRELSLEKLPLMLIHDPRGEEDMAVVLGKGGALEALRKMQDEGIVGSIGVATGTLPPLQQAVDSGEFDVIQFPRLYTLVLRAAKTSGLLEAAKAKGMGTMLAAPFTGNILATGVRGVENPLYAYWPAQPEVVEAVGRMQDRADELGITIAQAAVAYTTTEPLLDLVVQGVRSPRELEMNVESLHLGVSRQDLESIAEAGAVDEWLLGGPDFVWPFPKERAPEQLKDVVK
jgi:Predicted oxidoreductases (related to aryl-alcohol dehydrogenases)